MSHLIARQVTPGMTPSVSEDFDSLLAPGAAPASLQAECGVREVAPAMACTPSGSHPFAAVQALHEFKVGDFTIIHPAPRS